MLLTIEHITRYAFDPFVPRLIQRHVLVPFDTDAQKVRDWTVDAPGGTASDAWTDGALNTARLVNWDGPLSELEIRVAGTVETFDTAGVLRGISERTAPECYLRFTEATEPGATIKNMARSVDDEDMLSRAHALSALVSEKMTYVPGETHSHTTAEEAAAAGQGVCQDKTHILIALARLHEMPARYVTGYLAQDAGAEGAAASHAWAEIHVRGLGWIGFDPTNQCCPDERYVRLSSGLDSRDAAPIRGLARGHAEESLEISVAVRQMQQ